jgi:hypothetical protein
VVFGRLRRSRCVCRGGRPPRTPVSASPTKPSLVPPSETGPQAWLAVGQPQARRRQCAARWPSAAFAVAAVPVAGGDPADPRVGLRPTKPSPVPLSETETTGTAHRVGQPSVRQRQCDERTPGCAGGVRGPGSLGGRSGAFR